MGQRPHPSSTPPPAGATEPQSPPVKELVAPFMDGEELRKKLGKSATALELKLMASGGGAELGRDAQLPDLET